MQLIRRLRDFLSPSSPVLSPDTGAMRAFYRQFLLPGDLCFDIGSNLGNRLEIFRRLDCTVVALEPQSVCFETLRQRFGKDPCVVLLPLAASESEGELPIHVASVNTISSMSSEWIERVRASGRFAEFQWDTAETVRCTTLDALIAEHGKPRFIKIDVEGFEPQVVRGLSQPVPALSFEWTPEFFDATRACLAHLSSLGSAEANYSLGESMRLALDEWVSPLALERELDKFRDDHVVFGDVYIRFP
jgi:FkbM family methyltransferase